MKITMSILLAVFMCSRVVGQQHLVTDYFPTDGQGNIVYEKTVQLDTSTTIEQMNNRLNTWIAETFVNTKAVIQSRTESMVILKSYIDYKHIPMLDEGKLYFLMKVEMKQGRYRYKLYDVSYYIRADMMDQRMEKTFPRFIDFYMNDADWYDLKEKKRKKIEDVYAPLNTNANNEFKLIVLTLEKAMRDNTAKDDW